MDYNFQNRNLINYPLQFFSVVYIIPSGHLKFCSFHLQVTTVYFVGVINLIETSTILNGYLVIFFKKII